MSRPLIPLLFAFSLLTSLSAYLSANALEDQLFTVTKDSEVVFAANPDTFVSVGLQEYIAHPYRVLELSLTFRGDGNRLRIYALESLEVDEFGESPSHRAQAVQDRATAAGRQAVERGISTPVPDEVVKNYPHTTHAGTVEFLVPSLDNVRDAHDRLFREFRRNDSVRQALIEADIDLSF
ncbi:MAG: hypothetical protein JJT75_00995 [Opitutales bacterium]|nr:hypothetical protein [Opitutales bacterium]MCH8540413.1 hypothetical protein [Opitutales bacterium]